MRRRFSGLGNRLFGRKRSQRRNNKHGSVLRHAAFDRRLRCEPLEDRRMLNTLPLSLGDEFRVNSYISGDQTAVSLDADASGNYVAVWQGPNNRGFGTSDIYLQRYNAEGTRVGPEQRVHPQWQGEQTNPDIAVADDGTFVVSWDTDNDGDSYGVHARRFAANGSPLTDVIEVNTYTDGNQSDSEVAINPSTGEFVVVWKSDVQDGSSYGVYGQRFASDGTAVDDEFRVNTYTDNEQSNPIAAMDASGNFVVTWGSNVQDGSGWGVYGQRFASDGTALGGEFLVNTYTNSEQRMPGVAMDTVGNFVVTWGSNVQDGSGWGVYAQRYTSDGTAIGDEFQVNTYTSSSQAEPAVAMDTDGNFVVAWHSWYQDGSYNGVYAQRYVADGTALGGEFRANTYTGNEQNWPSVAFGIDGDFLIAWQDRYQDGSSYGIYAQLYGTGLAEADLVPVEVTAPEGANLGQTISVSAEIRNQGSADAESFTCQYYLSTDAVITTDDTPLGGLFTVDGLDAYETHTDSRQIQVLLTAHEGDFYIGLLLDVNDEVVEADETNNGTSTIGLPSMDVRAAASSLGDEFRVNSYISGDQTAVSLDADASGNYVAVWQGPNNRGFGTSDIYLQRYNAEGTRVGPEQRVHPQWQGEQANPDVAVADDGTFVVSWSESDGDSWGVKGRRFAANGSPLTDVIEVNTYTDGTQGDSEAAVNPSTGEFVVVWKSEGQDGSSYGVYGQRFAADGTPLGDEFRVNTYTDNEQSNPMAAMDASGNFVVTWRSADQDGSSWGVYGQRYASDGTAQGGEFQVNTFTSGEQQMPGVAMDAAGNFVITWGSYGQDGSDWGVYAQRYAADGTAIGDEFQVNTYTSSAQHPSADSVAMADDGGFLIAWLSNGQDGSYLGVYAQRYAADGTALGGEFRANTYTSHHQRDPAVAWGTGNDFLIGWQSYGQDGSIWGIYGQLYGEGLAEADLVPVEVTAPDGANLGQTIDVSARIRNQGSADAEPFTCQYYLSTDAVITTDDTPLGEAFEVDTLDAHTTHTDSRTLAVPDVVAGDWYVGIIVDTAGAVAEANEDNNVYQRSFNEPTVNIAALPMIGPEGWANTTTADEQSQPAVGFDAAGNYVAVWHSRNQDGSGYGIYGQRFDAAGLTVGSEFQANTTTDGDQRYSSVAVADDGRFVVAWESNAQDGSGWGVYAKQFGADGLPVADEFLVNTYTNSDQNSPSVGIDGVGNFIIVWRSNGQDVGNNGGIYGQRYLADGTPNGPEFWVCSNASPDQHRPVVAMNDAGQFVVTWDDGGTVYGRMFLADATPADDEFVVNSYGGSDQNYASVAMDAAGGFVVAWRSNGQDGSSWGVYGQRYASDGTALGDEFQVNQYTSSEQRGPSVAMDATGNSVITWHSRYQDGSGWGIFARRYAADGSPIGGEFKVNLYATSDQTWPAVAMMDTQHFIVSWQSNGQDGSSYGIFTQLVGLSDENSRANLVVSQLSAPGSVSLNETIDMTLTIQNTGLLVAPASIARLWLSDDDVFDSGDDQDTGISIEIPLILSGVSDNTYQTTVSYTWPSSDPFDTDKDYYFILQADSDLVVEETSEDDNVRVSNLVELRLPNLYGWVSVPSSILPGDEVPVDISVRNTGDASAPPSTAHLWLSDDNVIGNEDDIDLLIDIAVPELPTYYWPDYSYYTYQTTVNYTWPEPDPFDTDGQYYFVLQVDAPEEIVELDEGDNWDLSNSFGVNRPNLVVTSLAAPPEVEPGQEVTIPLEVRNTGTADAEASTLHLWLSDDAIAGNGDDYDLLIDVSVPALPPYRSPDYVRFQTDVTFTWPSVDPFGTDLRYYVVVQADVADEVAEGNETDNYRVSEQVQLRVPDLEAVGLRTPSTVQDGQNLLAHLEVQNVGLLPVPTSTAHVWLSDNNVFGDGDDIELAVPLDIEVPEILGHGTWSADIAIPWPAVDPFGTDGEYFVIVQLDSPNEIDEGNELNNVVISEPLVLVTPMDLDIHLAGHLGGGSQAAAIQGDYAYEMTGAGLRVLDISDPAGITKVSELVFPVGTALGAFVEGDRLYTVDDRAYRAFDISTPHQPELFAEHPSNFQNPGSVVVRGSVLIGGYEETLTIIDLSDPVTPITLAEYPMRGEIGGLDVEGATVYVAYLDSLFSSTAIEIVDITNLSQPTFVSRRGLEDSYYSDSMVSVSGNLLAIGQGYSHVQLIDVSDPTLPRLRGDYKPAYYFTSLELSGTTLYVVNVNERWVDENYYEEYRLLTVVDISDPTDPATIGAVDLGKDIISYYDTYDMYAATITSLDGLIYLADEAFRVIDVNDRFNPVLLGSYAEPWALTDITLAGSVACMVGGDRLELIDVSEPAVPQLIGSYQVSQYTDGYYRDIDKVVASGPYAVLVQGSQSSYDGRLEFVDISDPANPAFVAAHEWEDFEELAGFYYFMDIALDNNLLFILAGKSYSSANAGRLLVLDITDPAAPVTLSSTDLFYYAESEYDPVTDQTVYVHPEFILEDGRLYVSNTHSLDPEPNGTLETAVELGDLSSPVVLEGVSWNTDAGRDYDYYHFTATEGDLVTIDLRGRREEVGTFYRGYVMLYDSSGSNLISDYYYQYDDDDQGVIVDYALPDTDEYFVVVYPYSSSASSIYSYQLAVALNEPVLAPQSAIGLSVYDISDPADPAFLSTAKVGRMMHGVAADDQQAYVSLADPGMLEIWDFSDPTNPVLQGSAQVDQAGSLVLGEGLTAVAAGNRVQMVDVSDPTRPVALESYETAQAVDGLAAEGLLLFVAADSLYDLSVQPAGVEAPDLAVTQLVLPAAVQLGTAMDVGWTVRNHGRVAAEGTWTDAVYLSTDVVLDPDTDIRLAEDTYTGPLNSLATYSSELSPVVTGIAPGYYYVILHTDDGGDLYEGFVEANNIRVSAQPVYIGQPDLDVTHIGVPEVVDRGDLLPVAWTVHNRDYAPAGGSWTDAVYLSTDMILNIDDQEVGTLEHTGGLPARSVYHAGLDIDTTAISDDVYYVIVKTDSADGVFEDGREENNIRVSEPFRLGVPALTLGRTLTDTFDAAGQYKYYRVEVEAGEHLFVSLDDLNDVGHNELYVKYGSAPSRSDYDVRYSTNFAPDQVVEIADTEAGAYYILVYAESAPDAPGDFELAAAILDFQILGISPVTAGNAGPVTMSLRVAELPADATPVLVSPDGTRYLPDAVYQDRPDVIYPTFNLSGAEIGRYDVRIETSGSPFTELTDFVEVRAGLGGNLEAELSVPSAVRAGQPFSIQIEYSNMGDADIPAPMFIVTATGEIELVYAGDNPTPAGSSLHALGISSTGPAGILPPGAGGRIVIDSVAMPGEMQFSLTTLVGDETPINWDAFKEDARREWITPDDWDVLWPTIVAGIGDSWGDYLGMLDANATRRGMQRLRTASVQELFGMEICRALDVGGVSVISGVILDALSGEPLANTSLFAQQKIDENTSIFRAAETSSNGAFLIEQLPPGSYELHVDGYYFDESPVLHLSDDTDVIDLVLSANRVATVSGTVTTVADGLPIVGATVSVVGENTGHFESSRSSDSGQYEFGSLPADTYTVTVVSSSYVRQEITGVTLEPGEVLTHTDFSLTEGATIGGVVRNAQDLTLISGATFMVVNDSGESHWSITDSDGQYLVSGLTPGDWGVQVDHPTYQPSEPTTLTVMGQTTVVLDIHLQSGASVAGTITDDSGSPIHSALVWAATSDLLLSATTSSDGTYQFAGLAGGDYTLIVEAAGYAVSSRDIGTIDADSSLTGVDFQLDVGSSVQGTITQATGGTPIAGAEVLFQGNDGHTITTITQPDGSYVVNTLWADVYYVRVEAQGYLASQQMLNVPPVSTPVVLDVTLTEGASAAGTILMADGTTPIASALVALRDADGNRVTSTISDENGTYTVGLVPLASVYYVEVTHSQYTFDSTIIDLTTPGELTLDLSAASGSISGIVTDLATGGTIEGATVAAVIRGNAESRAWPLQTETASDGSYSFASLINADYLLIVTTDGLGRSIVEQTISSGESVIENVQLSTEHGVTGIVSDGDTLSPIAGATVWIVDADYPEDDPGVVTFTDETGSYEFAGLSAGQYLICIGANSYVANKTEVNVSGTTSHDVPLSAAGHTLSGTVADAASGHPLAGAIVSIGQEGYPPRLATTDSDGAFEIGPLDTGQYVVLVVFHDVRATQTIVLNGDDTVALVIALPALATASGFSAPLENHAASNPPLKVSTSTALQNGQLAFAKSSANSQSGLIPNIQKIRDFRATPVPKRPIVAAPSAPRCDSVTVDGKTYFLSTAGFGYRRDHINQLAYAADNTLSDIEFRTHNFLLDGETLTFNVLIEGVLVLVPIDTYTYMNSSNPREVAKAGLFDIILDFIRGGIMISWTMNLDKFADRVAKRVDALVAEADAILGLQEQYRDQISEIYAEIFEYQQGEYSGGQKTFMGLKQYERLNKLCDDDEDEDDPPEPDEDQQEDEDEDKTDGVQSFDPNDKTGPAGYGKSSYIIDGSLMPYAIYYENDPDEGATAAAQVVFIEDQLDTNLDLTTFELDDMNLYGDFWVDVPDGLNYYHTVVDLRPEGNDLLVRVTAGLDSDTRMATWLFESLDPDTMEPPDDALAGFLPVNDKDLHDGEGHLLYSIRPLDGLGSGTEITNQAMNYFDANDPVPTPTTLHTIDAGLPTSLLDVLPAQVPDEPFTVSWSGQDDENGSGVASYTIYVKEDDGDWEVWLQNTAETSAEFIGVGGHDYAFRAVAKDNVGHEEDDPGTVEASTSVDFSQLRVDYLEATSSGFVAHFKRAIDQSVLNLYDVEAGTFGPADFMVVGDTVGLVAGSLVYNEQAKTVTFIRTGGPLEPDTYTITLRSAADGFKDAEGHLLDGDTDDVEGGDYVTTATVQTTTAKMLSLPDFTRGPGQSVDVPAAGFGLPITIDDAEGVESIDLTITFDPDLLNVTGVSLGQDAPEGSAVQANLTQSGQVTLSFYSLAPMPAGLAEIVTLVAEVQATAGYGQTGLLRFAAVDINEGGTLAEGEDAIHVAAFLGETTGNQEYSGLDAQRIARVAVELDSGFAVYPMIDPVVIADITGNGVLSGLDANRIAQEVVGLDRPEVPPLPEIEVSQTYMYSASFVATAAAGEVADASLGEETAPVAGGSGVIEASASIAATSVYLPTDLTVAAGDTVVAPLHIDDAANVEAVDVRIAYDPSPLNVVEILPGSVWPDANTTVVVNVDETTGQIIAIAYNPTVAELGAGSLLEIDFQVAEQPVVTDGQTVVIDLQQVILNEDLIPVAPDPIGGDDPTDGLITIFTVFFPSQLDMVLVFDPAPLDQDTGEVDSLPPSEEWIEEWNSFYVEIWVSTPDTIDIGVVSAQVDLTFNPDYFTAMSVGYGPAFDQNQTRTIDNATGMIDDLGAATLRTDVGDDRHVLFARVRFEPTESNPGVPLVANGNYPQPVDNDIGLSDTQTFAAGGKSLNLTVGAEPDTDLWPVFYDIDDDGQVDLGDLAFFAGAYRENVAESANPYAAISDFDHDGFVGLGDLAFFASAYRQTKTDDLELPHPPSWPWETSPGDGAATIQTFAMMPTVVSLNTPPLLPGDTNRDGTVNDNDAATLATNWHKQTSATWSQGDFNGDGRVTDDDVAILAQHWMMSVEDMDDDDERDAVFAAVGTADDAYGLFDE